MGSEVEGWRMKSRDSGLEGREIVDLGSPKWKVGGLVSGRKGW